MARLTTMPAPAVIPLHRPPEPQVLDARRQHAAEQASGEQADRDEDDLAPPEAVGNGAVPQGHHGKGSR